MRLLHAARISRLGDAATGLDVQDLAARRFAEDTGHEIIGTATDTDVSGDTDPWARPGLGPWLTQPDLMGQYDGIIASHIDRLARSTIYLMRLLHWADDNGKRIITTGEQAIDFGTPMGKLLAYIISWLAEQELAAIKRRANASRQWLIDNGYLTGRAPFGYRIVEADDTGHKTLEPDPKLAPVVRTIVERYMAGETLLALCKWLDSGGIATPYGRPWSPNSLNRMLRSTSMYGRRRDANGKTVLRFDGILSKAEYDRLQTAMDARRRSDTRIAHGSGWWLTGIAMCGNPTCHRPMYRQRINKRRKDGTIQSYEYARCHGTDKDPSRCRNMMPLTKLDAWIDRHMTNTTEGVKLGAFEIQETLTIPGAGHDEELAINAEQLAELVSRQDELSDEEYDRRHAELRAERARLRAQPAEPDEVITRPTGITIGELWETLTQDEKRRYLLASGVKFYIWQPNNLVYMAGDPAKLVTDMTGVEFDISPFVTSPLIEL